MEPPSRGRNGSIVGRESRRQRGALQRRQDGRMIPARRPQGRKHLGAAAGEPGRTRMEERLGSFGEFWPFYVAQHLDPANRALHFLGTSLALAALAAAATLTPWWALAVPLVGYGPAWIGHFFFEKNKPATFRYPLWSLRGDLRMYALLWRGRMDAELARAL